MKKFKTTLVFTILSFSILIGCLSVYGSSAENIEITISSKERITEGLGTNSSSKFVVYSATETFENTDSWVYFKFNSADFQGKLIVDSTYTVTVVGWRVPLFSMYRNIVFIKQ